MVDCKPTAREPIHAVLAVLRWALQVSSVLTAAEPKVVSSARKVARLVEAEVTHRLLHGRGRRTRTTSSPSTNPYDDSGMLRAMEQRTFVPVPVRGCPLPGIYPVKSQLLVYTVDWYGEPLEVPVYVRLDYVHQTYYFTVYVTH